MARWIGIPIFDALSRYEPVPSSSPAVGGRRPFQRPQAGARDLAARHLGGYGIANAGARLACPARRARSREIEPLAGLDDVAWHALPAVPPIILPDRALFFFFFFFFFPPPPPPPPPPPLFFFF